MTSQTPCNIGTLKEDSVWVDLPALPKGLGGHQVAVLDDVLLVIGGSYWTDPPSKGGRKQFSDRIYALRDEEGVWEEVGRLPIPLAYSATTSVNGACLLIGGENNSGPQSCVYALTLNRNGVNTSSQIDLPTPITNAAATALKGDVYLCCGQTATGLEGITNRTWRSGLNGWVSEPPLPGLPRILPSVQACGGGLLVVGGAAADPNTEGASRLYLKDVWHFSRKVGWVRFADLTNASVAAPSLSYLDRMYLFGGDSGAFSLKEGHPGFSRSIIELSDHERHLASSDLPLSLVTTGAVVWRDMAVIAGGEDRPGHRSERVIGCNLRFLEQR